MSRNLNTPPSYPRHRLETREGARFIGFVKYWIPLGSTWRQNGLPSSTGEGRETVRKKPKFTKINGGTVKIKEENIS